MRNPKEMRKDYEHEDNALEEDVVIIVKRRSFDDYGDSHSSVEKVFSSPDKFEEWYENRSIDPFVNRSARVAAVDYF